MIYPVVQNAFCLAELEVAWLTGLARLPLGLIARAQDMPLSPTAPNVLRAPTWPRRLGGLN